MQHRNVDFAGAYIVPTLNLLLKVVILPAATLWAAAKQSLRRHKGAFHKPFSPSKLEYTSALTGDWSSCTKAQRSHSD